VDQAQRPPEQSGQPAVLPLRPLTIGELLDAAVALLRTAGPALLPVALILAAAEQAVLWPVRRFAAVEPPAYLVNDEHLGAYWLLLSAGFGLEAAIIALLGGVAARAAGAAVLGRTGAPLRLLDPRGGRLLALPAIAAVAGLVTALAALAGPVWAIGYAVFGLAVPALILDDVGPLRALGRSAVLVFRGGARGAAIRVLGYLGWLAVRVALGLGGVAALDVFNLTNADWRLPVALAVWLVVNTVAYPTLACLDAVLHLETRMRTEGLDIRLSRAGARGQLAAAHLAVRP
jgi:hypothetical protein